MWFKIREDKCEVSLYEWYIFCGHFIFLFIQLISFLLSPLPVAFCLKLNLFFLHLPEAVFSFLLQLLLISNLFPFPYFLNAYFLSSIPFPSYSFYLPAFLLVSPSLLLPIILLLSFLTSCTGTSKTLCSWLIDIVMRRIPTSLPPVFFATSYSPTPVFACTLTQPPNVFAPRAPEWLAQFVSSHIKQAWRFPRRQDPETATSARQAWTGACEGLWPLRWVGGGGREGTRRAMSRCHRDPNSRLGGCRREREM